MQKIVSSVTVLGADAVGLSYTGLFLANGIKVVLYDPRPEMQLTALSGLESIKWELRSLGYPIEKFTRYLSFDNKLHRAVRDADIIQECLTDELEIRQALYEKLGRFARPDALILSSSATFSASQLSKKMKQPENVLIGHSFDPPHLLPLVEVAPAPGTTRAHIDKAMAFYQSIGKYPVLIDKEIEGIVVNRLHFALLRESIHLITSGVTTVEGLDAIVKSSLGPRWAAAGPFKTLALAGGAQGLTDFFKHLHLDNETRAKIRKQSDDCYARVPVEDLVKERDADQIAILKALQRNTPANLAPTRKNEDSHKY